MKKTTKSPKNGKSAKTRTRPKSTKRAKPGLRLPDHQGGRPKRTDVGPGHPPVEHQFRPGQSGNPAGCPPARMNLWTHVVRAMTTMAEPELRAITRDKSLPAVVRTAARDAVQCLQKGIGGRGFDWQRYIIDREDGKPTEHVRYEREEAMTPEECEEVRRALGGQTP